MFEVLDFKALKCMLFDWYKATKSSPETNAKVTIEYVAATEDKAENIKVTISQKGGWTKIKEYYADGEIEQDFARAE